MSAAADIDLRVFADYDREVREEADVVVVGSGPCGAVVAKELTDAGLRVALVEEGPPFTPADYELDGALSMARTLREGGLRTTVGTVMPTMQAVCLGGGSLVNSAICVRAPDFVLDRWCTDFELAHTRRADLNPHYDAVGAFLGISPTPENVLGERNLLFKKGCDALGISSEPISRNVRGCRGSGECFTGCRSRAKQSMDISYLPAALRGGAKVLSSVRIERVLVEGRRATGVVGRVVAPFTGSRLRSQGPGAPGGARRRRHGDAGAAPEERRSRERLRSGGREPSVPPGVAMLGVFRIPCIRSSAHPGYQSLHFCAEGFKLETLWAPPPCSRCVCPARGRPQAAAGAGTALGDLGRDASCNRRSAPCARAAAAWTEAT